MVTFDDTFARLAGYNEWADANRIVVLYPQAESIPPFPNPRGCWDWWGYTDGNYATRSGKQMAAIRAMIDRVATHH
jgi:poly(3-hydroxybutyrate) depolymerase